MVTVSPLAIASTLRLPLPLYTSVPVGRMTLESGATYAILAGIPQDVTTQLRERSLDADDEALQNNTRDSVRFGPEGSYEAWYSRGRLPLVLLSADNQLAALAWYGPAGLPDDSEVPVEDRGGEWDTAGYRAYGEHRGKGLMTPFIQFSLQVHDDVFPGRRIWIETKEDNAVGRRVFQKCGFREYGARSSSGRILMLRP